MSLEVRDLNKKIIGLIVVLLVEIGIIICMSLGYVRGELLRDITKNITSFISNKESNENEQYALKLINTDENIDENINENIDEKEIDKSEEEPIDLKKNDVTNKYEKDTSKNKEKKVDYKHDIVKKVEEVLNEEESVEDYLEEETASVFKVHTSKILDGLTFDEKKQLFLLGSKLNVRDYIKIKDYLYAKDQEQGVLDAIFLMKERLSKEDYDKVKEISERFIDMDRAEEEYENNKEEEAISK